jgi:beta-N-acetylhexosaminidase
MTKASQPLGPLMLDINGISLNKEDEMLLANPVVGGLILFTRNYSDPKQLSELVGSIRSIRPNLLIAVDQEGGRVQRFRHGFTTLPALRSIGKIYEEEPMRGLELAKTCGWVMAAEIIYHGLDFSFAPVMDLYNPVSEIIEDRAFAPDVDAVCALLNAYIDGMNAAGMQATGKHFPGHGSVRADSHLELPVDGRPASQILDNDYQVFSRCIDKLMGIMPAHVKYPALDANCAGYSSYWIQTKLRQELQFNGVVFSDDLTMAAATDVGSVGERAKLALAAGCNMVLVCNDRAAALQTLEFLEANPNLIQSGNALTLARMTANSLNIASDLYNTEKWRSAKSIVSALTNS